MTNCLPEEFANYIKFRISELKKLKTVKLPTPEKIELKLKKQPYGLVGDNWKKYQEQETVLREALQRLKNQKNKKYLYKIDAQGENSYADILQTISRFKSDNAKKLALSKINANSNSNVLYIGSSEATIEKRLKEHLGFGSKSTYSMHLLHWVEYLETKELAITINLYSFDNSIGTTLLKNIEFAFWHKYKPILGKGELDLDEGKL